MEKNNKTEDFTSEKLLENSRQIIEKKSIQIQEYSFAAWKYRELKKSFWKRLIFLFEGV